MLQYPVQLPPLSINSHSHKLPPSSLKDHPDYFRHNDSPRLASNTTTTLINSNTSSNPKRFQKESTVSRSPFLPLSISTNLSHSSNSSPTSASIKLPRSSYISSRNALPPTASYTWASKSPSTASSIASSSIEDVLAAGDVVAEGGLLQGETIRLVSTASATDSEHPAKEFEVVRRLGAGSYAVVYLVVEVLSRPSFSEDGHMSTIGPMELDEKSPHRPETVYGREYAIKCLSKANLDEDALAAQMSEVTIHQSLYSHPNIAALYSTFETPSFLLLLLEYVPGEDLFYFLEQARDHYDSNSSDSLLCSRTPPTPSLLSNMHPSQLLSRNRLRLISSMFSQMCDAVAACHAQQVFHRDIKPENFIVTDGWTTLADGRRERKVVVKLTDFGLSTTDVESSDMDCGSAPYMSYECRNNIAPTYRPRAADVWSLGIVLINMLYHYNPWTDTAEGVCSSFNLFRTDPVRFFMGRFTGMTLPVADFLANKVFCILDDPNDDSRRVTAADFGTWVKGLPGLFGNTSSIQRTVSGSSQGYPIAASTPISHRPSSRHPSGISNAIRTPAIPSRSLSRAPSLGPAYEKEEKFELSTVLDQEVEEQPEPVTCDSQDVQVEGMQSRSTSTNKRRKRGARKGRGSSVAPPTSPNDDTLATLADASQSLAREISKASRTTSAHSSKPLPPVTPPAVPPPSAPIPVTKKPSKWKLGFGKNSGASNGRASPVEESIIDSPDTASISGMSTTASNVTNLIMGLNATSAHSPPSRFDDGSATWGRGRRTRPVYNRAGQYAGQAPPPAVVESWVYADRKSERAVSPVGTSSTRSRPLTSNASSMVSGNWRNSMSTTSSAATSTSAFTRYSNSSTRSISTTATSVSSATNSSWRTGNKAPASSASSINQPYPMVPKNVKIIQGIPWELDQLPRGQHPNPVGDIFGSPPQRKHRPRKPPTKDLKLDTITERPSHHQAAAQKSPVYARKDVSTSTTDLTGQDNNNKGEGETTAVKKVQKGQINALAKMLSALRR